MTKKIVFAWMMSVGLMLMTGGVAYGQSTEWSQTTACPGWNNPANFNVGSANFYYSGQTGDRSSGAPNVMTGSLGGMQLTSQMYNRSAMANVTFSTYGDCANIPSQNNAFYIHTSAGNDANTGNQLPYIPSAQFNTQDPLEIAHTNLTKSIRIGDACGGHNTNSLFYTLKVTPQNAMFYIYYACVVEDPGGGGHGAANDPSFVIRVLKQNNAGNWVQLSDTLAYMETATEPSQGGTLQNNVNGWHHSNSGYAVWWKQWTKVALNLTNYLDQNLRIQVVIGDCGYSQHFAYAYICGECRPMTINSSGCPPGLSTDVTTLSAPQGLQNYVWYASEWGVAQPPVLFNPGETNGHFTWRQLSPDQSTAYNYNVQASDFQVTRRYRANGTVEYIDSVGNWQTFRCKLTSALDPTKPITSYMYVNVQNQKPTMEVDSLFACDGKATLWNKSYVPGDPSLVQMDSTRWSFYNNPYCEGEALETFVGDSASKIFEDTDLKGVRVRTFTTDPNCYSDAIYPIRPRENPHAGFVIDDPVLCDTASTFIRDTTSGERLTREWSFRAPDAPDEDTTLGVHISGSGDENRAVRRSFTHSVEPIQLKVLNGTYSLNPSNLYDTTWCNTVVRDTVLVFLHPELEVTGDTVVCEGSLTNATVRAMGVDSCTYEWSLTPDRVTGGLPAGPTLQVTPYADTATYYVKVTSQPQGCVAWDSIHTYLVRPKLTILPEDGRICPGDVATLTGGDAHHFSWTASPADASLAGQENASQINVSPQVTTTYTMIGHGSNNCNATPLTKKVTIVPLPVPKVGLTPGFVDTDNPTMVLRDQSTNGVSSSWLFNDGSTATGREVSHVFENCIGMDSVPVTLTSYNALECPTVYPFYVPVNVFTVWFPTAFTPGSTDGNSKFSLFTINEYQYFHIYIYNRRGELVYESDDVHFQWDGTKDGEPVPQGAYVYTCRYRKPGTTTLGTFQGTITLIR